MDRAIVVGVTLFIFVAIAVAGDGNLPTQNRADTRRNKGKWFQSVIAFSFCAPVKNACSS